MKKGTKVYIQHINANGIIIKTFRKEQYKNQALVKITKIPLGYGYRYGDTTCF